MTHIDPLGFDRISQDGWGPWHLDSAACLLWTEAGGYRYEIDLLDCTTSAQVLDWIIQVHGKNWGDTETDRHAITGGLVAALDELLCPQATLCSFGEPGHLTQDDIRALATRGAS